jgi:hypothetical protein
MRFGIGDAISISTALIPTQFGIITVHVMPLDTLFLWSEKNITFMGVKYNNLQKVLKKYISQRKLKIIVSMKWGYL